MQSAPSYRTVQAEEVRNLTVKELRTRNAENLAAKMAEVQDEKGLTKVAPTAGVIQNWIDAAKDMEPKITH